MNKTRGVNGCQWVMCTYMYNNTVLETVIQGNNWLVYEETWIPQACSSQLVYVNWTNSLMFTAVTAAVHWGPTAWECSGGEEEGSQQVAGWGCQGTCWASPLLIITPQRFLVKPVWIVVHYNHPPVKLNPVCCWKPDLENQEWQIVE